MKHAIALISCLLTLSLPKAFGQSEHDVVVYGDSSGAVVAAISAKREGRSIIWVNPTSFPGGMSASGLGATDFLGKQGTFGGIAAEFYQGVAKAYGTDFVRSFEPHVGKKVFEQMIAASGVTVVYNEMLDRASGKGVTTDGKRIAAITTLSGKMVRGKMFIDATYVGDLMAATGVTFTVGRESESQYGEDMAGVRRGDTNPRVHYGQKDKDHFVAEVDPYVKAGDASSGLLPHIHKGEGITNGQGDKKIQAYNYRVCLTTDAANRIPIEKPAGYREMDHELLLRNFDAGDTRLPALVEPLAGTGQKVDWNNMHAVGSDYVGANWEYPEASYERRREIEKEHETYIRGFLWTMSNSPRVPEKIRTRTASYGMPKDEFTDNGGWPWMIYIREARRMSFGTTCELEKAPGFLQTADYTLQLTAPSGLLFNFADNGSQLGIEPILFWFARELRRDDLLQRELGSLAKITESITSGSVRDDASRMLPLALIWRDPSVASTPPAKRRLTWWSEGGPQPQAVMRSAWNDPRATFVGIKAGTADDSHAHMDIGSFILETSGVRWAVDLGRESYPHARANGIANKELFSTRQESKRWSIFRCGPESHNLIRFNNAPQLVAAKAEITPTDGGFSVELTPVVRDQVRSARRQFTLHADGSLTCRDTWSAAEPVEVTWQWITRAKATKTEDGFRLQQSGETLQLTAAASSELTFEIEDISAPRNKFDSANPNLTRLLIRLRTPAGGDGWLQVTTSSKAK